MNTHIAPNQATNPSKQYHDQPLVGRWVQIVETVSLVAESPVVRADHSQFAWLTIFCGYRGARYSPSNGRRSQVTQNPTCRMPTLQVVIPDHFGSKKAPSVLHSCRSAMDKKHDARSGLRIRAHICSFIFTLLFRSENNNPL